MADWIVGRITQGDAKAGRQPPWLIADPSDDELAAAVAFLDRFVVELPSGSVVVDHAALAKAQGLNDEEPF
jgi:hypothetical protein